MDNALDYLILGLCFAAMFGALFWGRVTGVGALASMLVGGLVVVGLMAWQGLLANSPIYGGLLASLVTFFVVSLLTPQASSGTMSAWDRRISGEEAGSRRA